MNARKTLARRARHGRVVVKVGSGVLTDEHGQLSQRTVRRIAAEIAPLIGPGRWPYVVSSGAVAVGMNQLGLKSRPRTIPGLQAAAAVGQSKLVEAWSNGFRKQGVVVAQVLLTHDDLSNRRRFLNARRTLAELERRKAVAVINENDTVSFEEIAVGDNDGLSAHVSNLVDADVLVWMSTAPGILDANKAIIEEAAAADPNLDLVVRDEKSRFGIGGMRTKLGAARAAAARGAHVAIIDGKNAGALTALLEGETVGTVLTPDSEALRSRHHWIAHTLRTGGTLVIDDGARKAIVEQKKSLLPSGVVEIRGDFAPGDAVDVVIGDATVARGLCRYSAEQMRLIFGKPSSVIRDLLGFTMGPEAVHRDDLVVLKIGRGGLKSHAKPCHS